MEANTTQTDQSQATLQQAHQQEQPEEIEPIYSMEHKNSQNFEHFLTYLSDKQVCLAIVKCKRKKPTKSDHEPQNHKSLWLASVSLNLVISLKFEKSVCFSFKSFLWIETLTNFYSFLSPFFNFFWGIHFFVVLLSLKASEQRPTEPFHQLRDYFQTYREVDRIPEDQLEQRVLDLKASNRELEQQVESLKAEIEACKLEAERLKEEGAEDKGKDSSRNKRRR